MGSDGTDDGYETPYRESVLASPDKQLLELYRKHYKGDKYTHFEIEECNFIEKNEKLVKEIERKQELEERIKQTRQQELEEWKEIEKNINEHFKNMKR